MTFTVTMAAAYDQTVTVKFSTSRLVKPPPARIILAKSGTLTFQPPGEIMKTITISIKGDNKREGDETFMVSPLRTPAVTRSLTSARAGGPSSTTIVPARNGRAGRGVSHEPR